jgi:succinate dehydrogenase / fumarate reductase membrane anchor subunit
MTLRTPLGRVLGTGSAKEGPATWRAERVSSVALIPLTLWFVAALLALPGLDYATVRGWLAQPWNGLLALMLVAVMTYHAYLGSRVIVEDYVHRAAPKLAALLLLRFAYAALGGASLFAILRIAFGSSTP